LAIGEATEKSARSTLRTPLQRSAGLSRQFDADVAKLNAIRDYGAELRLVDNWRRRRVLP
jgi:threonine dehydratase